MRTLLAAILVLSTSSLPAQKHDASKPPPTVATHYFYWYLHDREHFPRPGGEGFCHHFLHPETVSYLDAAWHETQFEAMAAADIDGALPVYWGFPAADLPPSVRFSDAGLPPMVEALDRLDADSKPHPKLGLFYDTSTLLNRVRGTDPRDGRADLTTAEGKALFIGTVLRFFEAIPDRHWLRHHGKPLVVLYGAGFAAGHDATLGDALRAAFAARFDGETPYLVADASWGDVGQDATTEWGAALSGPKVHGQVVQIGPGYDDSAVPGRTTPTRPREDGAFYRASWRTAIAACPDLVLIETWNEMHEGTEICRTVETGDRYLTLTRDAIERLRRGDPGPEVPLRHDGPVPRPDLSWGAVDAGTDEVRWQPGDEHGMRPVRVEDGPFEITGDTLTAQCPAHVPARYVYFQVSDHWLFDDDGERDVMLTVLGDLPDAAAIDYDSHDATAPLEGAYRRHGTQAHGTESGPGLRVWWSFTMPHARLANRENGGADFRLVLPAGTRVAIESVVLARRQSR